MLISHRTHVVNALRLIRAFKGRKDATEYAIKWQVKPEGEVCHGGMLDNFIIQAHSCAKWRKAVPTMHDYACLTMIDNVVTVPGFE